MCRRLSCPRPRVSPPSPPWGAAWSITGGRGEKKGSESESWHAEPVKLGVVTSAVLGEILKNEPFLHLLEVSLLHAL